MRTADGEWSVLALMLSDQCPWRCEVRRSGRTVRIIGGSLLEQADEAVRAVIEVRRVCGMTGGFPRMEFWEVLLNAITHRSYCDRSPTVVDVLPGITVIESPGGLVRIDESYAGRTRNPHLVRICETMGLKNPCVRGIEGVLRSYSGC